MAVVAAGATAGAGAAAAGTSPQGGRSAGCDAPAPQPPAGGETRTVSSGGLDRTVRVHLPAGYTADRPWPVLLVFHGRGSSGPEIEGFSGLSELPAIVAYPDGVPGGEDKRSWQGAPYSAPGVDDVAFTGDLLDQLEAGLCVDGDRVYATGKSNGGGFTDVLACRSSDRIAAVAPVAGAYYRTGEPPCEPGRPVPVLSLHGTGDATIPYAGDPDRELPPIPEWVAGWAGRDGCDPEPATRRTEPDITVSEWSGCASGADVEHVAVDGGGHTWPGATAYSGGGATTQTIRASELIWAFLSAHTLERS
ncbi:poly(3-hydroxybutyrate) depolymerase [Pseudonocardia sp. KRD-291]|nr:poly(3-hydroxybutyrate) depolymerase [Pseudonocardia sp. KRD291]